MTKDTSPTPDTSAPVSAADTPQPAASRTWLALASALLAILAWVLLIWANGYVACGVAAVAVICGFAGNRARGGAWRNVAVTALIASAVLLVVVAAFLVVLKIGLSGS